MTPGRLIAVVGPSGVGKDSVMQGIARALPQVHVVQRVITRPQDMGGEDHVAVTPDAFLDQANRGAFAVHWDAHGLRYGIPAIVHDELAQGRDCLANFSRRALPDASRAFANVIVLHITARPETLAARLAARGRESADDIARRLAKADTPLPAGLNVWTLSNDGPLSTTVARAVSLLTDTTHRTPADGASYMKSQPSSPSPDAPGRGLSSGTLCLANARVVLPDRVITGAVLIEDGVITDVTEGDHVPDGGTDCHGDLVLPGLVELHTDNLERHIEPRPAVDWPHVPALLAHDAELASTGITTVFDAMRVGSIHSGKGRYIDYARKLADELLAVRAEGHFKISHFLHLRAEICSETLLDELAAFGPDDRVGIVSLMDHTPGQRQFRDLDVLKTYIAKKRGMDDADFAAHVDNLLNLQRRFGARHQAGAVAEAARLDCVLASHDDTTAAQVATSAGHGVGFAEFPTTIDAARACRSHGIAIMMGAPNLIRGGSHSGNVAAEDLARADLLDIVSSDYVPSALLLSAFHLARLWDDLPRAVATVTRNPARAAKLTDRGDLSPGCRGDVLRVRMVGDTPLLRGVWSQGRQVA